MLNIKPSRLGTVKSLLDTIQSCQKKDIQMYGGGQFELDTGKQHNHAYTLEKQKQELIDEVRKVHSDETPIIEYTEIDGNQDFLDWIERNTF